MSANDQKVYTEGQTIHVVQDVLTDEGNAISRWCEQNMLKCNHDKFHLISFDRYKKKNKELNISILNSSVKGTFQMNLLGVTFDDHSLTLVLRNCPTRSRKEDWIHYMKLRKLFTN